MYDVGSHNPPPWGLTSSLAHCLASDYDTICNGRPNPPLADIVFLAFFSFRLPLKVLKRVC